MDQEKLNAKIEVVVEKGSASAKTEGNGAAAVIGFQALAVCIMDALVNDEGKSLEEVSECLSNLVKLATIHVAMKDFVKDE